MQANEEYIVPYFTCMNSVPSTARILWLYGQHPMYLRNLELDLAKCQFPQLKEITIAKSCYAYFYKIAFTSMLNSNNTTPITMLDLPSLVSITIMDENFLEVRSVSFISTLF